MDRTTGCPKCGKRNAPGSHHLRSHRPPCISCDDPAVKWAESPVTVPEKPIVLDRVHRHEGMNETSQTTAGGGIIISPRQSS